MAKERQEGDLEHLPACAAEFITLVIKKMRYRTKVQRDVQAELAAHFEDELRECATDEDKEHKAQKFITEFGDVKLLAILLRRAKKRCRPLWRTVIARTLQAVGIIIVCFIFYIILFLSGKPAISVDYLAILNQMNRPQLRGEDNAWPHYERAIQSYIDPPRAIGQMTSKSPQEFAARASFSDLSGEQQDVIMEWVQQNEKLWDELSTETRQLLGKCFEQGLVPYAHSREQYQAGHYRTFHAAVADILWKIKWQPGTEDRQASSLKQLAWEQELLPYDRRVIELDPNDSLDAKLINWFEAHPAQERAKIQKGIKVGALKYWVQMPVPAAEGLFGYLYPFERKLVLKWIRDNNTTWREFTAGSSKSYCYREYECGDPNDRWLMDVLLPHLLELRGLAKLGAWRSQISLSQGDIQLAIDNSLAVVCAGTHIQNSPTLIEQLVGIAMNRLGHQQLLRIISEGRLSAIQLQQLSQQLSATHPHGYPLINAEYEKVAFHDTVQHVFTDGGLGGGHIVPEQLVSVIDGSGGGPEAFLAAALGIVHARRNDTVAAYDKIFDKVTEIAKLTPCQRHKTGASTESMIWELPQYRYALIHIMMPALDRCSELSYRMKAEHEASLTVLALQRRHIEKAVYPADLNELVAEGYLREVPMDPFSDKPLVYKKTDDGFVLYSVGLNFADDGGEPGKDRRGRIRTWRDDGDTVFWPVTKSKEKR